jgi:hypothetical protein
MILLYALYPWYKMMNIPRYFKTGYKILGVLLPFIPTYKNNMPTNNI